MQTICSQESLGRSGSLIIRRAWDGVDILARRQRRNDYVAQGTSERSSLALGKEVGTLALEAWTRNGLCFHGFVNLQGVKGVYKSDIECVKEGLLVYNMCNYVIVKQVKTHLSLRHSRDKGEEQEFQTSIKTLLSYVSLSYPFSYLLILALHMIISLNTLVIDLFARQY